MSRLPAALSTLAVIWLGAPPCAAVPAVVTDIPPVQGIVAAVMEGIGTPSVLLGAGADPHHSALRPSEARSLEQADVVVWVGPQLSPSVARAVSALAEGATRITLAEVPGTEVLPVRVSPVFAPHDHDGPEAGDDAGHGDDHDEGHDHAAPGSVPPGLIDPHLWLDPDNAVVWAGAIAATLSAADPEHAATYAANAAAFADRIAALDAEVDGLLAPVRGRPFVVFHDAYQYFETRFDIPAAAAIALSDASDPGPARIEAIRAEVAAVGAVCALAEPQFNPGLIRTVFEGQPVRIVTIDHLGGTLPAGPTLYPELIRTMSQALADCLS